MNAFNRAALVGLFILLLLIVMATFGPYMTGYSYNETHLLAKNLPPSKEFWFGTDDLGRDLFTRVWYGARISLFIGVAAACIDMVVGVLFGGIAALAGGRTDDALMRTADILYAIPNLLIVIMLTAVFGSGLGSILIALTIIGWITMARVVRGQVLQLKNQEFVLAAKALGASFWRILFRHILPNAMAPILVTVTFTVPLAIFIEAFLSFLGLGIAAPLASLGTMASDGLPALQYYPWRLFFPGFFISLAIFSFNLMGDGLRDTLDPRLRK